MKELKLKKRIFLPLVSSGLILFLIGTFMITHLERRQLGDAVEQQAESLQGHMQSMLLSKSELMANSINFIVQDSRIIEALKSKDQQALLALATPIYQKLNKAYNITHFYFHDAARINLLRIHKPERYGDLINRFTLLAAEKDSRLASGIELGPLGTFTLRSVMPLFKHGQLLGYIELGQEIDDIIQQARSMFDVELYMLINKQYLDRSAWESGMRMLGRNSDWDQFPTTVLVSKSMADVPVDLLNKITVEKSTSINLEHKVLLGEHQYSAAIIPLNDAGGQTVSALIMMRDMTHLLAHAKKDLLLFIFICTVMSLSILTLFYRILGHTEHELIAAREKLIDEENAKAAMQATHIQQLQAEQEKLRESEEATRLLLNAAGEGIYGVDQQGNTIFVNPAACRILGYTENELTGQFMHSLIHHSYPDGTPYPSELCRMYKAIEDGQSHHVTDEVLWRKDGSSLPVEYLSTPVTNHGTVTGSVVVFSDITDHLRAQKKIERALQIQRVLDTILNISLPPMTMNEILIKSLDAILAIPAFALLNKGAIFMANENDSSLEMLVHRNLSDALLQSCSKLSFGRCLCGKAASTRNIVFSAHIDERHEIDFDGIQPHGHYCIPIMSGNKLLGVLNMYVPDGHQSDVEERKHLKTVADTMGLVIERKKDEESLRQLAHHDLLTGLPNRTLFYDRLEQMLALAQRQQEGFTLLFLDLDHFKEVNDNFGHDAGDLVLKQAATRLLGCVERKADTVARMGGDEFSVILSEVTDTNHAGQIANRIIQALSQPFDVDGKPQQLGCSVGIAQYPVHAEDSETLIRHADEAMYHAKRKRNTYSFFSKK